MHDLDLKSPSHGGASAFTTDKNKNSGQKHWASLSIIRFSIPYLVIIKAKFSPVEEWLSSLPLDLSCCGSVECKYYVMVIYCMVQCSLHLNFSSNFTCLPNVLTNVFLSSWKVVKWLTFPVFCPFCRTNGDSEVIATFFKGYDRAIRPNIGLYEQPLRLAIIVFNLDPRSDDQRHMCYI